MTLLNWITTINSHAGSFPTLTFSFAPPTIRYPPAFSLTSGAVHCQRESAYIYINLHNLRILHTLFLLFLSSFDDVFILIGHSKQCVQSRRARGILKIERYAQRLTHMTCIGEERSYS